MIYSNDIAFLKRICSQSYQKIYIKIDLLNLDEIPIDSLEGIATGGNISIDGTSALQRSCSVSLNVLQSNYFDSYWSLNSKINLQIGVNNDTDQYVDFPIIYFPMGIYYLTSFSASKSTTGYTVSIQGKDKMCKLTGDIGGIFNSSIDFGAIDVVDVKKGTKTKEPIPIKNILVELIHHYGYEPYEKIIINDIEDYGLNLTTYRGNNDIYYFVQIKEQDGQFVPYIINSRFGKSIKIEELEYEEGIQPYNPSPDKIFISYNNLKTILSDENLEELKKLYFFQYKKDKDVFLAVPLQTYNDQNNSYYPPIDSVYGITEEVYNNFIEGYNDFEDYINLINNNVNNKKFFIGKYSYGDTIGYELTPLVYPGDLIANPGETVTSILDKIKNMLGDYIYFYDLNGNFVFKKKDQYLKEDSPLNISFSIKNPSFILSDHFCSSISYSQNLSNIKNDYTVWGEQKLANGITSDIHARIAIDEKPIEYTKIKIDEERAEMLIKKYPNFYYSDKNISKEEVINGLIQDDILYQCYDENKDNYVDWREIVYQMALDYNKFNYIEEYADWLGENNYLYQKGETGYERYYSDLLGFWREIYNKEGKVRVSQLYELKSDDNIKYSIQTTGDDSRDSSDCLLMTTQGIIWRGGRNCGSDEAKKARQDELRKEIGLENCPTIFEIQLSKDNKANRFFPNNKLDYYKEIKWDIKSDTFPDITLYRKIINQNTFEEEFIPVGTTNEIIKTNYKILEYMYYMVSPWVYWNHNINEYLISEDINTNNSYKWGPDGLWRILQWDAKKTDFRYNTYNNKNWTYVKNNKALFLGTFYDITSLYYNTSDMVNKIDESNITKTQAEELSLIEGKTNIEFNEGSIINIPDDTLENFNSLIQDNSFNKNNFMPITSYPKNKDGAQLTNITNVSNDKMALVLYAKANRILFETDNNFGEDGFKKDIKEEPDKLKFWFDFLPADKFNQAYSIANIGPREIVKKDNSINCITSLAVPDIILINPETNIGNTMTQQLKIHQSPFKAARPNSCFTNINSDFVKQIITSSSSKSAMDVISNLLYDHVVAPNSLTITSIPQYYFDVDCILSLLESNNLNIKQYIINKISFNLDHSGLMTLNVNEFVDDILNDQVNRDVIINIK